MPKLRDTLPFPQTLATPTALCTRKVAGAAYLGLAIRLDAPPRSSGCQAGPNSAPLTAGCTVQSKFLRAGKGMADPHPRPRITTAALVIETGRRPTRCDIDFCCAGSYSFLRVIWVAAESEDWRPGWGRGRCAA